MKKLFGVLLLALFTQNAYAEQLGTTSLPTPEKVGIWISTDPGCSLLNGIFGKDPDDCIALEVLRRYGVRPIGISSVGGNVSAGRAWSTLRRWRSFAPLHRGGIRSCESPAIKALVAALKKQRLRIVALGALTDVAMLLQCAPRVACNIDEVIFVGGRFEGKRFRIGNGPFTFSDLNYERDRRAFREVHEHLRCPITITVIPYHVGVKLRIKFEEIWLLVSSELKVAFRRWSSFNAFNGGSGLAQFDSAAVMYVLFEDMFRCEPVEVRPGKDLVMIRIEGGSQLTQLCEMKNPEAVKAALLEILRGKKKIQE